MKVYKIYTNAQGHYQAVKQGWSWPAFGFSCLWAMTNKIWRISTVSLILFIILGLSAFMLLAIPAELITRLSTDLLLIYTGYFLLGICLLMGLNGNVWYEKSLALKGYTYQEMVVANDTQSAIVLYVKQSDENDSLVA